MHGLSLSIRGLHKKYPTSECPVFNNFSLEIAAGSLCAIVGPSGIGKTTLLNCIAGLDGWDSGIIYVNNQAVPRNNTIASAHYRRTHIGMAFQQPHLLPEFTVEENLLIPFRIAGNLEPTSQAWITKLSTKIGVNELANRLPETLSGGQAARVCLIRALANKPSLWLLDEPTGNLDPTTADEVFNFLLDLHHELRPTTLLVTHNMNIARRCEHIIQL
jgi:putative ABC transport system ATP-binding protein